MFKTHDCKICWVCGGDQFAQQLTFNQKGALDEGLPSFLSPRIVPYRGIYRCVACSEHYAYEPGGAFLHSAINKFTEPVALEFELEDASAHGFSFLNPWLEQASDIDLTFMIPILEGDIEVPAQVHLKIVGTMALAAPSFATFLQKAELTAAPFKLRVDPDGLSEWLQTHRPYLRGLAHKVGSQYGIPASVA